MTLTFRQLVEKTNPSAFCGHLIALDPGETTGYAVMHDLKIVASGQLTTQDLNKGYDAISWLFGEYPGARCITEDYRVYSWKTEQHNWAGLHTPKFIGMIHTLAIIHNIPIDYEMAVEAKGFCTDKRLEDWGLWVEGQRHARDAIRHACFYTLFKTGAKQKG